MLINVNQLNVLKKARDKAETEDKELFNALSIAIIRLENHVCPNLPPYKENKNETDYWDAKQSGESQKEKYGK